MTYNFDPDQWLDAQVARIDLQHGRGELDDDARAAAISDVQRRYDEMVARLDGTYQIPAARSTAGGDHE